MRISTHKIASPEEVPLEVLTSLMISNPDYEKAQKLNLSTRGIPRVLKLYKEVDDLIYLPREIEYATPYVVDETQRGHMCKFQSKIKPKEEQEPAIQALVATNGGILEAGCGKGKTVMALEAIARVGRPALVLVHKEFLMEQWKERCIEFLGEEPGIIQGKKCDYAGKRIVIGMIQSLVRPEKYPKDMLDYFGVVVTDEVHRISASTWSEVIQLFPAKVRWGLTATTKRDDGLEVVFKAHIGQIVYTIPGEDLSPDIYAIPTKFEVNLNKLINRWSGQVSIPNLITAISKDGERNKLVLEMIESAAKVGRKILVLSERIDQLKLFLDELTQRLPEHKIMLYIGATPPDQRAKADRYDVLLGTMSLAKEGLDIPRLDTLFLVTPTGSEVTVQQSVGRIVRTCEGKSKTPLVVDFVDGLVGICNGLFQKRKKVYARLGYEVKIQGRR